MLPKNLVLWLIAVLAVARVSTAESKTVVLDGRVEGRVFEGIGALSAGASSRLMIDYAEPYRSQVLDYLFRTNYGASLHHIKVEIGGDVNSTDGCEPSHMHRRDDQNYHRGYEWWLMGEARRRNPAIYLDCLEWGAPAWIGNGHFYSQDNADYIANFLRGARNIHGLKIQYVGIWNETRADMGWIKLLRRTLDRKGLHDTQIVAADDINRWNIVDVMRTDAELERAIQVVGVHYPKFKSTSTAINCGKPIWASEDGPWKENWTGASALAKAYNRNYIEGKMTKTIIWSPVTSYYDNLPLPGSGLMRANAPWSGHYQVQPALWATAHTTQFARPGWKYLEGDACGFLPTGGSLVTLKSENRSDYSVIIETLDAKENQEVTFRLAGGLSTAPVHVWRSTSAEQFVRLDDIRVTDSQFTITLDSGAIYSLTTTTGQTRGGAVPPPPAEFPLAYSEDFEGYAIGDTPKYFSDQAGVFEVVKSALRKGRALRQVVDRKGIEWPFHLNPYPETFLGSPNWRDYEVSVEALLEEPGFVSLFARVGVVPQSAAMPNAYWLKVNQEGYWELGNATFAIASGRVPFSTRSWRRLSLQCIGTTVKARLDDRLVAEVTDNSYACGMAGVGSGWHGAQFDNLRITVDPSDVNLAFGRPATASSALDADTRPAGATDGDAFTTRWSASNGRTAGEWIEIDLGRDTTFNSITLKPFEDRIMAFKIQHWRDSNWEDAFAGRDLGGSPRTLVFAPVSSSRVRLLITEAKSSPSIWEFEVRNSR